MISSTVPVWEGEQGSRNPRLILEIKLNIVTVLIWDRGSGSRNPRPIMIRGLLDALGDLMLDAEHGNDKDIVML